ncbi:MAG: hypothetical protein KBE09_02860 [Candidatus Pacebacteria bacterium]|nr:hypothetical protein [Candidatus Paceibacterota bacterium]
MALSILGSRFAAQPELIVDIGSGSIAVAIVELSSDEHTPSKIRVSKRVSLPKAEEERPEGAAFSGLVALIEPTMKSALEMYASIAPHARVGKVTAVLHAPWISVATSEEAQQYEKETLIAKTHIDELAQRAIAKVAPTTGEAFEKVAVRTELNGYPTGKPLGKTAHRMHVVTLTGSTEKAVYTSLIDALTKALPGRQPTIRTAANVTITVLNPLARRTPHYSALDITSEASGVLVVSSGKVQSFATIPIGWRTLIRELAKKYVTTPEEATSRLRMAIEESCTGTDCMSVLSSLSDVAPQYTKLYAENFAKIAEKERMPSTMIITAPPDIAPWFVELIARLDFAPFTDTGNPFVVQRVQEQHIADLAIFAPGIQPDAGVALDAAFVHMRGALQG